MLHKYVFNEKIDRLRDSGLGTSGVFMITCIETGYAGKLRINLTIPTQVQSSSGVTYLLCKSLYKSFYRVLKINFSCLFCLYRARLLKDIVAVPSCTILGNYKNE